MLIHISLRGAGHIRDTGLDRRLVSGPLYHWRARRHAGVWQQTQPERPGNLGLPKLIGRLWPKLFRKAPPWSRIDHVPIQAKSRATTSWFVPDQGRITISAASFFKVTPCRC